MQECRTLARAVKEFERRNAESDGFKPTPGDYMAYKYWRDALECTRKQSDMEMYMNKGLAVADSDGAKAKLVRPQQFCTCQADKHAAGRSSVHVLTVRVVGFDPAWTSQVDACGSPAPRRQNRTLRHVGDNFTTLMSSDKITDPGVRAPGWTWSIQAGVQCRAL